MFDDRKREIILAMADCNLSIAAVAEKLHFNRNNIVYHMNQIKKKTGLNPRNFYDLVELLKMLEDTEDDTEPV